MSLRIRVWVSIPVLGTAWHFLVVGLWTSPDVQVTIHTSLANVWHRAVSHNFLILHTFSLVTQCNPVYSEELPDLERSYVAQYPSVSAPAQFPLIPWLDFLGPWTQKKFAERCIRNWGLVPLLSSDVLRVQRSSLERHQTCWSSPHDPLLAKTHPGGEEEIEETPLQVAPSHPGGDWSNLTTIFKYLPSL